MSRLVLATPRAAALGLPARHAGWVASALVVGAWLWLFRGVFDYLGVVFTREDFRTSQLVLVTGIVLLVARARHERWRLSRDGWPRSAP
jgi:hypothetical protein